MMHFYIENGKGEISEFINSITDTIDGFDGCLLDNFIGYTEDGTLYLALERYQNAWMSKYEVFGASTEEDRKALWEKYYDLEDAYYSERGEDL